MAFPYREIRAVIALPRGPISSTTAQAKEKKLINE
jgi:hypothetical protein